MRYLLILDPCDATDKKWWNKTLVSANSLLELNDKPERWWITWEQPWHVLDTKNKKVLSKEEFLQIVQRLYKEKYEREHPVS